MSFKLLKIKNQSFKTSLQTPHIVFLKPNFYKLLIEAGFYKNSINPFALASEKPAPPRIPDCDRSMWLSSHDPPPLEDPHVYPLTASCFGLVRSNLIAGL
jgi:hypothetical protein